MLLKTNILNLKRININVDEKKLLIKNYNNLIMNIQIKIKNNVNVQQIIRNQKKIIIFFKSIIKIFVELYISTFLLNKNYLFEFNYMRTYIHIINVEISFIYIKNDIDIIKTIFQHFNLNTIIKYNVDLCLATHSNDHDLIIKNRKLKINALKNNFDIKINNDILMCDIEKQIVNLKTLIIEYVDV